MIIDIYSDLHLDTWRNMGQQMGDRLKFYDIFEPDQTADLVVLAGDNGNGMGWTSKAIEYVKMAYGEDIEIFWVFGNHDYYRDEKGNDVTDLLLFDQLHRRTMVLKNGFTIVGGTWWTNFHGSHESGMKAATGIMDFYRIKELVDYKDPVDRYQLMRRIHEETTDWMRQQPKADMIVTHFPPALQSIHGTYEGDSLNPYFVNDAEDLVRELEPRFWVHGHTHNPFDYMIGKTRVVANPIGYPGERFLQGPFKPLRIEVCDI